MYFGAEEFLHGKVTQLNLELAQKAMNEHGAQGHEMQVGLFFLSTMWFRHCWVFFN